MRLSEGASIRSRELTGVRGETVALPAPGKLIHLQFRRFAGCPVCNLHLRSVVNRIDEITGAGVAEVVVFHSPAAELRSQVENLPFPVIADPGKRLYREFGVESGRRALLHPRAWGPILRGIGSGLIRRDELPSARQPNGRLGLPADFLIDQEGRILAAGYGTHVYDQWPVDRLLGLARGAAAETVGGARQDDQHHRS